MGWISIFVVNNITRNVLDNLTYLLTDLLRNVILNTRFDKILPIFPFFLLQTNRGILEMMLH